MSKKNFTTKDLKSGYVVELENGSRYLVTRVNQDRFRKIIANRNSYISLNSYDDGLRMKIREDGYDIVKVWGLTECPLHAFSISNIDDRPLLWERPKLLNCKICIISGALDLQLGRIYEVKNGYFNDLSGQYPDGAPLESVDDLREYLSSGGRTRFGGQTYVGRNVDFVVVVED